MKKPVHTEKAPKAIGPYSQAISVPAGEMIFTSGQIPLDPTTGGLVDGDISVMTERVMKNLEEVLHAAGCRFHDVVKATIYLVDMNDFTKVNEVYGKYFPSQPPARSTVAVAALPKGARVEIDMVAVKR
ncbi:MAG: RidA family protein [Myxococcota bacterium]